MGNQFIMQTNKKVLSIKNIVTIFYLENKSDFVFEGEAHDFWEFAYVDKGSMVFLADGKEFLLQNGEIVFHKPNEFHRLEARRLSSPNISVVSFSCDAPIMKYFENKIFKLNVEEKELLSALLKEGLSTFSPLTPTPPIYGMKEIKNTPFASKQMTFGLLEQFLIALVRRNDGAINRKSRSLAPMSEEQYPKEIKDIIEFMDKNISRNLRIKEIATEFSMSESSLKKLFFNKARCGITDCFNGRKLIKAKQLIRENQLNFTEIAETLGFNSIHYFSKLFKLKIGMTPSEYRQSIKK